MKSKILLEDDDRKFKYSAVRVRRALWFASDNLCQEPRTAPTSNVLWPMARLFRRVIKTELSSKVDFRILTVMAEVERGIQAWIESP